MCLVIPGSSFLPTSYFGMQQEGIGCDVIRLTKNGKSD
jgi:hypothetical protein